MLEAAANGRADAIVTFNARDFAGVVSGFDIEVLTPVEILRRIKGKTVLRFGTDDTDQKVI